MIGEYIMLTLELIGTVAFAVSGSLVATVVSVLFILVFRLLAAHYRWKLPKIKLDDTEV